MKKIEWNLMVIAAASGESLTPVQLQKVLFIVGENVPSVNRRNYYRFKPYNYGPFSKEVYSDAEDLVASGDVAIVQPPGQAWNNYRITPQGLERAERLREQLHESERSYIDRIVKWVRGLTFRQLLAFIYKQYPDYAKKSMFKVQE